MTFDLESFKSCLSDIEVKKTQLEYGLAYSVNKLQEYCSELRIDVDLATEKAIQSTENKDLIVNKPIDKTIQSIQLKRNELLKQINDYETKRIESIQHEDENEQKKQFEWTIKELSETLKKYSDNKGVIHDSNDRLRSHDLAKSMKNKIDLKLSELDWFIFNKQKVCFELNKSMMECIGRIVFKPMHYRMDSAILTNEEKNSLTSLINFEQNSFTLLWRGSRDGFGGKVFHSICDGKENTLTIVKSTSGYIFGGYTSIPWQTIGKGTGPEFKFCENSFLFTLTNPRRMPLKLKSQNALRTYDFCNCGPKFAHDLKIGNNSNSNSNSFCRPGFSFQAPCGLIGKEGGQFIHGGGMGKDINDFQTVEVEIFLVT